MSLGPVILDLESTFLSAADIERLKHPQCGGVILFTRNFESVDQLTALVTAIRSLRDPHLIVSVDHEGGRVQRFHEGFTRLPPAAVFGRVFDKDKHAALELTERAGWLMASELRACGIDLSYAPVLDLGRGISGVIGDRAFHHDGQKVARLAHAYMVGMKKAGMAAVGKHFPGHGSIKEDSHVSLPLDKRPLPDILAEDVVPFERMIEYGLDGIMPAHVIYSEVDTQPAGFSSFWLKDILRKQLGFQGVIFSDDLSMAGAEQAGSYAQRAKIALDAGCDVVLVCNHTDAANEVLESLEGFNNTTSQMRMTRLHGRHPVTFTELKNNRHWQKTSEQLQKLVDEPNLEFDI